MNSPSIHFFKTTASYVRALRSSLCRRARTGQTGLRRTFVRSSAPSSKGWVASQHRRRAIFVEPLKVKTNMKATLQQMSSFTFQSFALIFILIRGTGNVNRLHRFSDNSSACWGCLLRRAAAGQGKDTSSCVPERPPGSGRTSIRMPVAQLQGRGNRSHAPPEGVDNSSLVFHPFASWCGAAGRSVGVRVAAAGGGVLPSESPLAEVVRATTPSGAARMAPAGSERWWYRRRRWVARLIAAPSAAACARRGTGGGPRR